MKSLKLLSIFALLGTLLSAKTLVFGVVPQQSPLKLVNDWQPLINRIQNETGEKVILKIERSIPEFERNLYGGKYDIAYMNPYHYVIAHQKQGYIAKVRDSKKLTGILIVRNDSGFTDVSMLKGKKFLFPAPDAFAATLLAKYELLKRYGINIEQEKKFQYVNSHDSVYKGIARGIGDVGGGIERTFDNFSDTEAKSALKIIYRTQSYPSHPFAFKSSMPAKEQAKITKVLLALPQEMLDSLNMKQIIVTNDAEYDDVRDIVSVLSTASGKE
ncbi:phosphate/phosphite/phosphonate ABC transporter substrate-binding protein [uncultured Sulfuricurvum sp.]|uniref:phosphate/phosphite/phosphonate ABC transporter substrate-binding protein n=1 Tax=uncultured Sulfuricurvum sp. TaxID=430693 RepID=UPI002607ABE0|nr:phosphate/phosphite/phosphonate ABC transporter substrate-binding protein [uncultured Sulfuricurvum sp.]